MARFGLWMADLCITHIMQVGVAERQRNTVFGVHNALCQTFSVLKVEISWKFANHYFQDLLVIALPDPRTFGICILISYCFVCSGYFCYVLYLLRVRIFLLRGIKTFQHPETDAEKSQHLRSSDSEDEEDFEDKIIKL